MKNRFVDLDEPIITVRKTGKEITSYDLALKMYKAGSPIVYCDIEGIVYLNDCWYILDECGHWDYIDMDKYKIERRWEHGKRKK